MKQAPMGHGTFNFGMFLLPLAYGVGAQHSRFGAEMPTDFPRYKSNAFRAFQLKKYLAYLLPILRYRELNVP